MRLAGAGARAIFCLGPFGLGLWVRLPPSVTSLQEERVPAVDALLRQGEEEGLRVRVLVNEVEPSFLGGHTFLLTALHKARILDVPSPVSK